MGGIINTYVIALFTYFIENILFLSVSEVLFIVDILTYFFNQKCYFRKVKLNTNYLIKISGANQPIFNKK